MFIRDAPLQSSDQGLYVLEAQFVTQHLVIRGEVESPDARISDHLNSSMMTVEIKSLEVERNFSGRPIDLLGTVAHISKQHLVFIIPLVEPNTSHIPRNAAWALSRPRRCWAALGLYQLEGKIYADANSDVRVALRALQQKQFLPFTEGVLTHPDGHTSEHETIIVNRGHAEMLALNRHA